MCAIAGLLLLIALPAAAQDVAAVVRPDPLVLEISDGQVGTLDIVLENAQDVYAIDVRASFDPEVIEVLDADPNRDGVQMIPGTFLKQDFMVRNLADNGAGTLWYALTQVNPTQPVTGTGVLFSVRLRGKAAGGRSELKIGFVEMANRRGIKLAVQPQDGTIEVIAASAAPATETPPASSTPTATPTTPQAPAQTAAAAAPTVTPAQPPGGLPCAAPAGLLLLSLGAVITTRVRGRQW